MVFISMTLMMLEDELFLENVQKLMHAAIVSVLFGHNSGNQRRMLCFATAGFRHTTLTVLL